MFSIVIPVYNKGEFIRETISSILDQSYREFEVILVNDGSTDNSLEVIKTFTDERIVIVNKENGGVSSARNVGIENARFPYVAFMDADDSWDSNYLSEMLVLIEKYPDAGLFCSAHRVQYKKKVVLKSIDVQEGIVQDFFKTMLSSPIVWTSATIIKKQVLIQTGGFPVGMVAGQDSYLWAKIALDFNIAFTPKVLATYNMINTGETLRVGKLDTCSESWYDFYSEGDNYRNEFIAEKGIQDGLRYVSGYHKLQSRRIETLFSYTKVWKRRWWILYMLNRMPNWAIASYRKVYNYYMYMKFSM